MARAGCAPLAAVLVFIAAIDPLGGRALAFAPTAAAAVAARTSEGLPAAARWDPAWNAVMALAVERAANDEDAAENPEADALRHRFDALRPRAGLAPEAADQIGGLAPFALAEQCTRLERAFAMRDVAAAIEAAAALAARAVDLSDPFLVTASDPAEAEGARAWFSEVGLPTTPQHATGNTELGDPLVMAMAAARESAGLRAQVEDAARRGDVTTMDQLRTDRLTAALALAARLTLQAWARAGAPDLGAAAPATVEAWVRPNPARTGAALFFASFGSSEARLELFDLAGRRVAQRRLGTLLPGPHKVELDSPGSGPRPAGVYLARVTSGNRSVTARFIQVAR